MIDWDKPDYASLYSQIFSDKKYIYKRQSEDLVKREMNFLKIISDYGYSPKPELYDDRTIKMKKIKQGEVTDSENFMSHYQKIIDILKKENIRHGDLTTANVLVYQNKPIIIDWNESRFYDEDLHDKRPQEDMYHLHKTMVYYADKSKYPESVNVRVPQQWRHIKRNIPKGLKTVIDLGAGTGDLAIRFKREGYEVRLVDSDMQQLEHFKKHPDNASLLFNDDIIYFIDNYKKQADIMCCMAVLPYFSEDDRKKILKYMADNSTISFIEVQYEGDGPGYIRNNGHLIGDLQEAGFKKIDHIGSTIVEERFAERRIWKCSQ